MNDFSFNTSKKVQYIEDLLFKKYGTSIDVSKDMYGYIITPQDNRKLAYNLEVEVDSEEYNIFINKIEEAVNLLF